MRRRSVGLLLALALCAGSLAGCGGGAPSSAGNVPAAYAVAALKGPTAMGLVGLMDEAAAGETDNAYTFTLAAAPDEVSAALAKGELDIACVPANLAAVLYQRTEGQIVTLAVNTLGVLYLLENGNAVRSVADLAGKTIAAAGKGSTPEYALRYLLEQNGLDPDADVALDWKSEHTECVSALAAGEATLALLPQPFVTVAQGKLGDLRVALDLTEEWDRVGSGSALLTGVVVARRDAVEDNPGAVGAFLADYAESVDWVNGNIPEAAQRIGDYGIVDAAVAERALPACNIVCITGAEMREKLSGYLSVLLEQDPAAVGGALPGDDFYYGADAPAA